MAVWAIKAVILSRYAVFTTLSRSLTDTLGALKIAGGGEACRTFSSLYRAEVVVVYSLLLQKCASWFMWCGRTVRNSRKIKGGLSAGDNKNVKTNKFVSTILRRACLSVLKFSFYVLKNYFETFMSRSFAWTRSIRYGHYGGALLLHHLGEKHVVWPQRILEFVCHLLYCVCSLGAAVGIRLPRGFPQQDSLRIHVKPKSAMRIF